MKILPLSFQKLLPLLWSNHNDECAYGKCPDYGVHLQR